VLQEHVVQLPPKKQVRPDLWLNHRIFFCTPQILANDLTTGTCPFDELVCLVLDECHRSVGDSDYVAAVQRLMASRAQLRILALSATPGTNHNKIQVRGRGLENILFCCMMSPPGLT
jgi:ERCC4-related helicase